MPWVFGEGHGMSIPHQRRGDWPLFRQFRPSVYIAQGTTDKAVAASNRHGTDELWSPGPTFHQQLCRHGDIVTAKHNIKSYFLFFFGRAL